MSMKSASRARETTTTTGTGTYSLAGAVTGFATLVSRIGSGNSCCYCVTDGTDWEVGVGTVTSGSPNTLSRDAVLENSSGDASPIDWGEGEKSVFVTFPGMFFNWFAMFASGPPSAFNAVTGEGAFAMGQGNDVSGNYAMAVGNTNTVSQSGAIAIGQYNTASGANSFVLGSYAESYWRGSRAVAEGQRAALGDTQSIECVINKQTTGSSPGNLGWYDVYDIQIRDNRTYAINMLIGARQYGGGAGSVGDSKSWEVKFMLKRSGSTYTLVGSATKNTIANDAAASAWDVTPVANANTICTVTGEASKSINWVAHVRAVEVG